MLINWTKQDDGTFAADQGGFVLARTPGRRWRLSRDGQQVGGDGTQAANWTMTAGTDTAGAVTGAPTAADSGDAVAFTTDPTGAGAGLGYFSTVSIVKTSDLSVL